MKRVAGAVALLAALALALTTAGVAGGTRSGGQATAQSEPMSLAGPVLALWPADAPSEATVVVRNLKTGNYEASRLGLACAQ